MKVDICNESQVATKKTSNTIKYIICKKYNLYMHQIAQKRFLLDYQKESERLFNNMIEKVFAQIKAEPIKLLTYTRECKNKNIIYSPHDFLLNNGKTVSFIIKERNRMVTPREFGNMEYGVFYNIFCGKTIENNHTEYELKYVLYNNKKTIFDNVINKIIESDYVVIVDISGEPNISIIEAEQFKKNNLEEYLSYSIDLHSWNESNILKYKNMPIIEIQIHRDKYVKCRVNIDNLINIQ